MRDAQNTPDTLRQHVMSTYVNLRVGIGVIAGALPLLLWFIGYFVGERQLLASMSAYYHSPLRDVFVGALFAVGLFLYLYKGYSTLENWALNVAGVCALGVALVATAKRGTPSTAFTKAHGAFAITLFVCIAYVAIFRAVDTLSLLKDPARIKTLRRTYRSLGAGMAVSPLLAVPLTFTVSKDGNTIVFFLEAVGVWMFAAYWLVKSRELALTGADRLAAEGELHAAIPPTVLRAGKIVRAAGLAEEPEAQR